MRILLALDDSKYAASVLEAVLELVTPTKNEVRLLNVVQPFPVNLANQIGGKDSPDFVAARMQQREASRRMMGNAARKLRAAGFKVSTVITEGDPRSMVLSEAEAWNTDLIVVGSHSRTGLKRLLLGSVSAAVTRHAPCSVQVVRARPAK